MFLGSRVVNALMLYVHNDSIVSSDWHILHRNIYWFLPAARSRLSGAEDPKRLSSDKFFEAERNTYHRLFATARRIVERQPVECFVFLGDLVFGLNRRARADQILDTLETELSVVLELFEFLASKGIRRQLILGNHDDFKLQHCRSTALYRRLFDDIDYSMWMNGCLHTHFPLGYSLAAEATKNTENEKFYRMHKKFKILDQKLLAEIGDRPIRNLHGHIHEGDFGYPIPGVEYVNVAIDIVSLAQAKQSGGE